MFKLILIVTILATGQTSSPMEHNNSPFATIEECFAAAAEGDANVREYFGAQVGSPVSSSYECQPVKRSSLIEERAADGIRNILREMNRRGGIAAAGVNAALGL